jgi:hypothetical protein
MNTFVMLIVESLVSLAVSLAVLRVLSQPLVRILRVICPEEHAATFWLTYTKLMLIITPLFFVLLADMLKHFNDPMDSLRFALIATLTALLVGLNTIGTRLNRFVKRP